MIKLIEKEVHSSDLTVTAIQVCHLSAGTGKDGFCIRNWYSLN